MPPLPARRRPPRRSARVTWAVLPLILTLTAGCGLLPVGVPGAPDGPPGSAAGTPPIGSPSPTPSASPDAPSASATGASRPTWLPSYPVPTEPACALSADAPDSIAGADGPTLTVKQVAKAWRASEAGKSIGVSTGRVDADIRAPAQPAVVLVQPGLRWVKLDYWEWAGLRTYVLPSPGHAAAPLAAIRTMVREPCSYPLTIGGPYVVMRLSEDDPDAVVVTGGMDRVPMMDVFVRHGNTVSHYSVTMMVGPSDDIVSMIRDALAKA